MEIEALQEQDCLFAIICSNNKADGTVGANLL